MADDTKNTDSGTTQQPDAAPPPPATPPTDPSPQQRNLLLTDDLQGGQAITSGGVTVYMPVVATTDAGEAQTEQYAAFPSPTCSR